MARCWPGGVLGRRQGPDGAPAAFHTGAAGQWRVLGAFMLTLDPSASNKSNVRRAADGVACWLLHAHD